MRIRQWLSGVRRGRHGLLLFAVALILSTLFWAKAQDQFKRVDFNLKTAAGESVVGIAVLPKSKAPSGTVVYLHGSGGSLMRSGNHLRQFAGMGLAGVGIEYNQTNRNAFDEEFSALNQFLLMQRWSKPDATAWVGYSLGANYGLSYALRHPDSQPHFLVCLSGGWSKEIEPRTTSLKENRTTLREPSNKLRLLHLRCATLLIQGENDEIYLKEKAERLVGFLRTNGTPVNLKTIPGQNHSFGDDHALMFRLIAESCKTALAPREPLVPFSQNNIVSHLSYFVPVFLLGAGLLCLNFLANVSIGKGSNLRRTALDKLLRWLAWSLAMLAIGELAFRLVLPQFSISKTTLKVARNHLVSPHHQGEFALLSSNLALVGRPLKELLTHAQLANYNRSLVNWQIEDHIYNEFVLSPEIGLESRSDGNWRKPLWENIYPRIRKEKEPVSAARVIVRFLRERVTVVLANPDSTGISADWAAGMTDAAGFERIYIAALRSVGIGAKLNAVGQVELWTGDKWIAAPRPPALQPLP